MKNRDASFHRHLRKSEDNNRFSTFSDLQLFIILVYLKKKDLVVNSCVGKLIFTIPLHDCQQFTNKIYVPIILYFRFNLKNEKFCHPNSESSFLLPYLTISVHMFLFPVDTGLSVYLGVVYWSIYAEIWIDLIAITIEHYFRIVLHQGRSLTVH